VAFLTIFGFLTAKPRQSGLSWRGFLLRLRHQSSAMEYLNDLPLAARMHSGESFHKTRFSWHGFVEPWQTLVTVWHSATQEMTGQEYQEEMIKWQYFSKKFKPKRIYDSCTDFNYPINPEEQKWTAELLNPIWVSLGLTRYAHILPKDRISELSANQLFEEIKAMKLLRQFDLKNFHHKDKESAWQWLVGKNRSSYEPR